jgi:hypothetical protein
MAKGSEKLQGKNASLVFLFFCIDSFRKALEFFFRLDICGIQRFASCYAFCYTSSVFVFENWKLEA